MLTDACDGYRAIRHRFLEVYCPLCTEFSKESGGCLPHPQWFCSIRAPVVGRDLLHRLICSSRERITTKLPALFSSYHPSLALFDEVFVLDGNDGCFWLVKIGTVSKAHTAAGKLATHAGGREIHIFPLQGLGPIGFNTRCDPISRHINPRKMMTTNDLSQIRACFPSSSGIQNSGFRICNPIVQRCG